MVNEETLIQEMIDPPHISLAFQINNRNIQALPKKGF